MNSDLERMLIARVHRGGYAYVRNLAAAEAVWPFLYSDA